MWVGIHRVGPPFIPRHESQRHMVFPGYNRYNPAFPVYSFAFTFFSSLAWSRRIRLSNFPLGETGMAAMNSTPPARCLYPTLLSATCYRHDQYNIVTVWNIQPLPLRWLPWFSRPSGDLVRLAERPLKSAQRKPWGPHRLQLFLFSPVVIEGGK